MSRRMLELDGRHMELNGSIRAHITAPVGIGCQAPVLERAARGGAAPPWCSVSRLIMFARALSQELRDDELAVSLDHCSRWEAPRGAKWGLDPQGNGSYPTEGSVRCN
jgi:hypothetical protein